MNFYSASIPDKVRLNGAPAKTESKSKIDIQSKFINKATGRAGILGREGQVEQVRLQVPPEGRY